MSYKWRIYCTEPGDEGWQYVWSDTEPTECPNNPAHSININSISKKMVERQVLIIYPNLSKIKSEKFTNAASIEYDVNSLGTPRRASFIIDITGDITNFDVQLYDNTNQVVLLTQTFNVVSYNTEIYTTDAIGNTIGGRINMEISIKKNDGKNSSKIDLKQIIIYA